ncbi:MULTISPECIES: thiamine phosphate synthase [Flavobacterium]|uniref:Thiamine-phosphate synthase n=1 Tax=Flavobacterium kayseriense TaxID=2764714 RepID=A0ABR7J3X0_9FLAO|nr:MULTISPECIES: thiamine phosphate synthase [Flavobacterium]MBC5840152.1 thiamine phosphate synthase [Flavobacterium kayseriense]MBC5847178.1 thiamine phosphate synthase [Flavobacterium kayseriense]
MFNKLQYISQGNTVEEQTRNIHQALDGGCKWIQLRFKNKSVDATFALAEAAKILCEEYLANFIINDNVYLAQQIAADGVHLGLTDMSIKEARSILGDTKIIGATANTFEDIQNHIQNGCDYIGLGPFRFTTTKENLSPILGLEGYQTILNEMKKNELTTPVYAIGGIGLDDIPALMETGIHGIAVSGLITQSEDKKKTIKQLKNDLYGTIIV